MYPRYVAHPAIPPSGQDPQPDTLDVASAIRCRAMSFIRLPPPRVPGAMYRGHDVWRSARSHKGSTVHTIPPSESGSGSQRPGPPGISQTIPAFQLHRRGGHLVWSRALAMKKGKDGGKQVRVSTVSEAGNLLPVAGADSTVTPAYINYSCRGEWGVCGCPSSRGEQLRLEPGSGRWMSATWPSTRGKAAVCVTHSPRALKIDVSSGFHPVWANTPPPR